MAFVRQKLPDRTLILSCLLLLQVLANFGNAAPIGGNPNKGDRLFNRCRPCHGSDAGGQNNRNPVPLLGGQHSDYIVMALNGYAGGERDHSGMKKMVKGLSARDKLDIGAYLSQFELKEFPIPESGQTSDMKQKIEACRSCHGERGNSFSASYPRIIGQKFEYLVKVLKDYKDGSRKNPTMVYVMKQYSDSDLRKIAEYYAGQPGGLSSVR